MAYQPIFPKSICPKVNVIARLEFEFTYFDSTVQRFNHYTTRTSPQAFQVCLCGLKYGEYIHYRPP